LIFKGPSDPAPLEGFSIGTLTQNMALVTIVRLAVELRHIESVQDDVARFKCLRDLLATAKSFR
jgi:hypothetical protein